MIKNNLLRKQYTLNETNYQLKIPMELDACIPANDCVRLIRQFVEEMDLTDLYSTYERINSVSPRTLLKIVLYSYMNGDYSSRSMELNCKRDINFMFFLEGIPAPDRQERSRKTASGISTTCIFSKAERPRIMPQSHVFVRSTLPNAPVTLWHR